MKDATLCRLFRSVILASFYPRAREGRDQLCWVVLFDLVVSIRAPVKDATIVPTSPPAPIACFYPRAREGRDRRILLLLSRWTRFYPRAREGRDGPKECQNRHIAVSIRAPVKDATFCIMRGSMVSESFLSARP